MRTSFRVIILTSILAMAALTACTGSSGVSTISGSESGGQESASRSPQELETAVLDYVECLRGQGLNVPDPTVDADGNISLGGRPPVGGGAGPIDLERFRAAQEVCGQPPQGLGGGFAGGDPTAFQDAALKFAECMRGQGVDVADPDFSGGGGPGGGPAGGGLLGNLDQNDPKTAAALDVCRKVFADAGLGEPGGGSG